MVTTYSSNLGHDTQPWPATWGFTQACGTTGSVLSQSNAAGNAIVWSVTQVHDNVFNIVNVAREQCANGPPTYLSCASCSGNPQNLVDMFYEVRRTP